MKNLFEISRPGRKAYSLPEDGIHYNASDKNFSVVEGFSYLSTFQQGGIIPQKYLRQSPAELPEVSEPELVKHYTALSKRNFGVDSGFYPLGSCTMKYNPKVHEDIASMAGFSGAHPLQPEEGSQGCLEVLYSMDRMLSEIAGMARFSLQPAAGAHGEMTGLMIMKAYHRHRGEPERNRIIVPDSSHGTNPASAAMAGFEIIEVKSDSEGNVDIEALRAAAGKDTAGLMLTNPNTLGLFEKNVGEIARIIHDAGGLLYYDGANANAILGITRPGDMGFDIVHLNLHKTFSTPHGGGGPGSGPVGVKKELEDFLPLPLVGCSDGKYFLDYERPLSVGKIRSFYGNFGVVLRAYAYILSLGAEGLRGLSGNAVLNANYLMAKLRERFILPYDRTCMHEFVLSGQKQKDLGVSTMDMAKRILDFGMHPPTVYFPLIVREAIMIEPTESWSRETLDEFAEVMLRIADEAEREPEVVRSAPHDTAVGRLDETKAARTPVLVWPQE